MKAKKVLAMLMASAMIMGTSVTAFAYEIPITNDNANNAVYDYVQVIEPATNEESGWKFVSSEIAKCYTDAFGLTSDEESPSETQQQEVIWKLLLKKTSTVELPVEFQHITAATDAEIAVALANIKNGSIAMDESNVEKVDVDEAGVYYILGNEEKYDYSPMAAYVGFTYDEASAQTGLESEGVTAKKAPKWAEKKGDAEEGETYDKVTEVERIETYTVTSTVPYFAENETERVYIMRDTLTGGAYVTEQLDGGNKIKLTVTIGDEAPVYFYGTVVDNKDGSQSFVANLSEIVLNNNYQNKEIEISYQAVVKDTIVENDVKLGDADTDNKFGHDSETLYTGNITITKYASDGTPNTVEDNDKLAGAVFKVYKGEEGSEQYAKFNTVVDDEGMNVYLFAGWTTDKDDVATDVTTGSAGTAKVEGLDLGTYQVIETVAPKGYSLNTEIKNVRLGLAQNETEANAEISQSTYMIDTTLSDLPSTGGIGTTIFTIGGCAIMVTAAGLYFATRKKTEK